MLRLLDPYRWLLAGLAVMTLIGAATWYHYRTLEKGREEVRQQVAAEAAEQLKRAQEQTANLQEVKDEAIEQATKRAQANAAAAARARTELDRLRKQIGDTPSVPGDTCAAAIDRAAAYGELLGECAARYSEVARAADRHSVDAKLLRDAWPVLNKEMQAFDLKVSGFAEAASSFGVER